MSNEEFLNRTPPRRTGGAFYDETGGLMIPLGENPTPAVPPTVPPTVLSQTPPVGQPVEVSAEAEMRKGERVGAFCHWPERFRVTYVLPNGRQNYIFRSGPASSWMVETGEHIRQLNGRILHVEKLGGDYESPAPLDLGDDKSWEDLIHEVSLAVAGDVANENSDEKRNHYPVFKIHTKSGSRFYKPTRLLVCDSQIEITLDEF